MVEAVGAPVGEAVGEAVRVAVGAADGALVGAAVGEVGAALGAACRTKCQTRRESVCWDQTNASTHISIYLVVRALYIILIRKIVSTYEPKNYSAY